MRDFIRETRTIELLPDEQIRQGIRERLQGLDRPPESMMLIWRKEKMEYLLEIVLEGKYWCRIAYQNKQGYCLTKELNER